MSDALIGCQPRIDEPSNARPSSKRLSLRRVAGIGGVLPDAREVDELEVDELDVVLLRELDDFFRFHSLSILPWP